MSELPESVIVLDSIYTIKYFETYIDVDPYHRQYNEGCFDPETSCIRIYAGSRSEQDIRQTLLHEIVHAIGSKMKIELLASDDEKSDEAVDKLAIALNKLLQDNIWL